MTTTLITGASRGLGKTIANFLLNKNHKIINLSRSIIDLPNDNFKSYKCDITNFNETNNLVKNIMNENKINNVILNSGITSDKFFHKMKYDDWFNVINTNLISSYGILNPVINQMRENKNGNIVFISSVNAFRPSLGQTNYSSSKLGLIALSRNIALENSNKGIRSNVICPGYINTEMTNNIDIKIRENIENEIPLKKFCETDDICNIIDLLLDKDSYIQGSVIDINGGLFMR